MIFCIVSFLIAKLGLDSIIAWSMPVLMFLYPVAIVLVALTLTGRFFGDSPVVLRWTLGFTAAAAVFDFLRALPGQMQDLAPVGWLTELSGRLLPFSEQGFGWAVPAVLGLAVGLMCQRREQRRGADVR